METLYCVTLMFGGTSDMRLFLMKFLSSVLA